MRKLLLILLVVSLLIGCDKPEVISPPPPKTSRPAEPVAWQPVEPTTEEVAAETVEQDRQGLEERIEELLSEYGVEAEAISFVITDLRTGESFRRNDQVEFVGASLYKLPLAMLYYDEISAGRISPQDAIRYDEWMFEEGPLETSVEDGDYIPIEDLLYYLITVSDNISGHMLYSHLGGWEPMRQAALKYTDDEAYPNYYSGDNYLTADYLSDVLGYLYDHPAHYAELFDLMAQAEPTNYLNASQTVATYQKIGHYEQMYGAAGLVLDGSPYSIVVMSQAGEIGLTLVGEINRIAHDFFGE